MTEPVRSMAASLANLEAHRPTMNATSTAINPATLEPRRSDRDPSISSGQDQVRAYVDKAASVLGMVRSKTIEIDTAWRRQRAAIRDELTKLDHVHERDMARLADMERRLEIMRGEQ